MPLDCLHMTTLEVAHSLTELDIESLVAILGSRISEITNYTYSHRARLLKPLLSYDSQAVALSFLPASNCSDEYTYHHLRRDLFSLCKSSGLDVASRYTVPSAHLTIARFTSKVENIDRKNAQPSGMEKWVRHLEEINTWLKIEYWAENRVEGRGEWIVGNEKGLDCRKGTLWYGGGTSVYVGQGF